MKTKIAIFLMFLAAATSCNNEQKNDPQPEELVTVMSDSAGAGGKGRPR